jgi:hypothetical protein
MDCCLRVGRPSLGGGLDFRENRLATQSDTRDVHDLDASFASFASIYLHIHMRKKRLW